jgi:predicted PurR-regulated permease PerM
MQAFDKLPRWLVWEIALPLTILNVWLLYKVFQTFQTLLTVLVAATLLSFLLNYLIEQLKDRGIKPGISIALILLLAAGLLGMLGFVLVPALLQQLGDLGNRLPDWLDSGSQQFQVLDAWLESKHIPLKMTALATQLAQMLPDEVAQLPDQVLEIILGIADRLLEVLITTVLTIYLLLHGDDFWSGLLRWLPGNIGSQTRLAFRDKFKNYFVGQATIALLMATSLTTVFFLLNIPYWLVFGVGIGLLALIPFGDLVGIFTAAIIVSFNSILNGVELVTVALLIDQIIDNAVAPKILGDLVGLNPVWIVVLLLIGSQLAGVLGLLLVVPLAGALKRIFEEVSQTNGATSEIN